jgi:hypothetical protein
MLLLLRFKHMGAGFAFVTTSPIPENVFSLSSLASLENKIQATTARKNKAPLVRGFGFKIL